MKKTLAICLLLALASLALAEVKIDGPTTVKDRAIIKLKVAGAKPGTVMWDVFDSSRARLKVETDDRLQGELWFVAPAPGSYEVEALYVDFEAKKFDRGRVTVTVGEGPAPPVPPVPPNDPLAKALTDAYASCPDADKATSKPKLAAIWRNAAAPDFLAKQTTWGGLLAAIHASADAFVGQGKLAGVRKAIGAELSKVLPTAPAQALDDDGRKKAAAAFAKVAAALDSVKGAKK